MSKADLEFVGHSNHYRRLLHIVIFWHNLVCSNNRHVQPSPNISPVRVRLNQIFILVSENNSNLENNFHSIATGIDFTKMQLCVLLLDACRRHTAEFVWTLSNANLDIIIRYVSLRIELQSAAPTMHYGWISVILFKNLWLLTIWLQVVEYFPITNTQ